MDASDVQSERGVDGASEGYHDGGEVEVGLDRVRSEVVLWGGLDDYF